MYNDIRNRDDIYLIVNEFYKKLPYDKNLHHFFEKFSDKKVLEEHLNTLVDFWDNILFQTGAYTGNAMIPHLRIHEKTRIDDHHFESWLQLFNKAVDENFSGENASNMKSRAFNIATVIKIKTKEL